MRPTINIEPILLKIKNRRLVVLVTPAVVGLLIGYLLILKPGTNRLKALQAEMAGLQEKVPAYQFIVDGEKKTKTFKTRFSGDQTWLVDQINSIAESTGISILSISPDDKKKMGEYLEAITVRIEEECTYHQLGAFMSRLESLDACVRILAVSVDTENHPGGGSSAGSSSSGMRKKDAGLYSVSLIVGLFTPPAGVL